MSAWIKDKLPDSDLTVLVRCSGQEFPIWPGYHNGDEWRSASADILEGPVIGWMELDDAVKILDGGTI